MKWKDMEKEYKSEENGQGGRGALLEVRSVDGRSVLNQLWAW